MIPCGFGVSCQDSFHYLSGLHDWGGEGMLGVAQRDRRVEGRAAAAPMNTCTGALPQLLTGGVCGLQRLLIHDSRPPRWARLADNYLCQINHQLKCQRDDVNELHPDNLD